MAAELHYSLIDHLKDIFSHVFSLGFILGNHKITFCQSLAFLELKKISFINNVTLIRIKPEKDVTKRKAGVFRVSFISIICFSFHFKCVC